MRVLAIGEPHAVHAFPWETQVADLARLRRISNTIDPNACFVRHTRRDRFVKIGALLILNHDIARDLHFVRVGIIGMRHLPHDFRIGSLASKMVSAIGEVPRWAR